MHRLRFPTIATLAVATALAVAGCGSDAADDEQSTGTEQRDEAGLVVCTSVPFPPAEFVEDGELVGYDIDVMDEVGRRLKLDVRYEQVEFDAILDELDDGTCQAAISSMSITPEREERATFIPYLKGPDPDSGGGNGEREVPSDEVPPLGIAVAPDEDVLAKGIESAITAMYDDGAMKELISQWDAAGFLLDQVKLVNKSVE